MAVPLTTVWDIEPHTQAKHEILKRYLRAWLPILSQGGFPRLLYIDGFAGPGRYSRGEDGSPVIALKAALDLKAKIRADVKFLFVEKEKDRAQVLREIVDDLQLPPNFTVEVAGGKKFEEEFRRVMGEFSNLPPTFAFIDPFGWTGAPFDIVKEIMCHQSCEVLVTFMYEEINRFITHPDQEENFDIFFGTKEWRGIKEILSPQDRSRFLHGLYRRQLLNQAKVKFVRSFQMRNRNNSVDYYLFYATNSLMGLKKMKEAMWKVDETGEFFFSDATDENQMILFSKEPQLDQLKEMTVSIFSGKEATCGDVERFVLTETAFRETHYKKILKDMEMAVPPELEPIHPPVSRRRGSFPDPNLILKFR